MMTALFGQKKPVSQQENEDYFDKVPNTYDVLDDRKIICCNTGWKNESVFGKYVIPSSKGGIYTWTFKVIHYDTSLYIGITSDIAGKFSDCFAENTTGSNYAAYYCGYKLSKGVKKDYNSFKSLNHGDIMKMELDLNKKTLGFWRNDENLGPAYKNIDVGDKIKYKMAISMLNKDTKIELSSFKVPSFDVDEKKQDEVAGLKQENAKLRKELNETKQLLQSSIADATV